MHPTHASQQVWQQKVKTSICKRVEIGRSKAIDDKKIFPMVSIGGAIVRPSLWSLQPTEGNGRESP